MAKALFYDRTNRLVKTIDTVTSAIAVLGPIPDASADPTSADDARTGNHVAIFRGDVFMMLRASPFNEVRILRFDGVSWNLAHASLPLLDPIHPVALFVRNDHLVAVSFEETGNLFVAKSPDGVAWSENIVNLGAAIGPASPTVQFRLAMWLTYPSGLRFWDFDLNTAPGATAIGDDGGLGAAGAALAGGCFASWQEQLFFLLPSTGTGHSIYRLNPSWTVADIGGVRWYNQLVTGLPDAGARVPAADGGVDCLFTSKINRLCAFYSGPNGTFLAESANGSFPAFMDLTATVLPPWIQGLTEARIRLYEDDRRRTNQRQFFFITDVSTSDTKLFEWDGVNAFIERAGFTGFTIIAPNSDRADEDTYTAQEPAVYFSTGGVTQPNPGQMSLIYNLIDTASRLCDISAEYSFDGKVWYPMTEGIGSDGITGITSSPAPGTNHTFIWNAYIDLDEDQPFMHMRIVPRIAGV